jgi:hypothetical protein
MDEMAAVINVVNGNILATPCDVLVLKYARRFYGADQVVATVLGLDKAPVKLSPGEHRLLPTNGRLPATGVLFVGVEGITNFGYSEIRSFARDAL